MQKKLNISRWLMYISVILLILFQAYWLHKVYQESFKNLQREVAVVLREALVKEQFSQIFGNQAKQPLRKDSIVMEGNVVSVGPLQDSAAKTSASIGSGSADSVKMQVRLHNRRDKRNPGMQGYPPRFMAFAEDDRHAETSNQLKITLPVTQEVFQTDSILEKYRTLLQESGLPWKFTIAKSTLSDIKITTGFPLQGTQPYKKPTDTLLIKPAAYEDTLMPKHRWRGDIEKMPFNLLMADFDFGNPFWFIIQKMYGQIAIAIFMTGMVILALRFMYQSLLEQQRMAVLKNDFISNMTHELKTPVATVSVAIEALKNFSALDDPAKTKEYLEISGAELNRLALLIDKVLRIHMFEADKLQMDTAVIDLGVLAGEVVQAQQLQALQAGATLQYVKPDVAVKVKGDRLHLMSVLYNLLDNALKYRSTQPNIEVTLNSTAQHAILTVKDNGPGIAAAYQDKIFEKFFRVPTQDRHDVKGYGLGLSYVHEVVSKHGGSITTESEPGKGCTFKVHLPLII